MNGRPPHGAMSRRRFIRIAAAGAAVIGGGAARAVAAPAAGSVTRWRGIALGAQASLTLVHADRAVARAVLADCIAEITRLEKLFSLYDPDSALSRLNRAGQLDHPPADLLRLLSEAGRYTEMTDGAFDVTVQPLFALYRDHFRATNADPAGPPPAAIAAARARTGWHAVSLDTGRIAFARPGMALTLNGIAQGYITDRVCELLRRRGFTDVLVDLGEVRALGRRADGAPWRAEIIDPAQHSLARLQLRDRALATSAAGGYAFDPAGRFGHLLDPETGRPARGFDALSVLAPTATRADALSTGLSMMTATQIDAVARRAGDVRVRVWPARA